jgi:phosphonate transport system substrate-binding protein
MTQEFSRRRLLLALAAAPLPLLAACGGAASPTAAPKAAEPTKPTAAAPTTAAKPAEPTKPAAAVEATKPVAQTGPAAPAKGEPGSAEKPLRMAFVPSVDSQKVLASGKPLGDLLEKETGYRFEVSAPTSYAAVVEAVGAGNVDVAWLAPFAYVLARQKFEAQVILSGIRNGSKTYFSQIIAHADSGIGKVEDLKGKRFAFVDSASASGYLYPAALIKEKGGDPATFFSQVIYAGGHDKVVIAVYNKNVDGGATFGNSGEGGPPTDARTRVTSTLPDVMDKVKVVGVTDPIPNDTVSVRKGLPEAVVTRVQNGLLEVAKGAAGKQALKDLYSIENLSVAQDADYDSIRRKAQLLGFNIEDTIKPAPTPTVKP